MHPDKVAIAITGIVLVAFIASAVVSYIRFRKGDKK
jgi:hypothetical protein